MLPQEGVPEEKTIEEMERRMLCAINTMMKKVEESDEGLRDQNPSTTAVGSTEDLKELEMESQHFIESLI